MRRVDWLAMLGLAFCSRILGGQVRADPGVEIGDKISVRVTVTLSDAATQSSPVRGARVVFSRPGVSVDSATAMTDDAGVASLLLQPGGYRLVVAGVEWQARRYAWDVAAVVRAGMSSIDLTALTATPPNGSPIRAITGRPETPGAVRAIDDRRREQRVESPTVKTQTTSPPLRLLTGSFGFLHTPEDEGMSLSFGMGGVLLGHLVGFVFPLDLGIVPNKSDRYYTDTFDNGNSVCRDSETGRFASKSNCAAEIIYAASAEAGFALATGTHPVYLTGGYRVGAGQTAFGALSIAFQPMRSMHAYGKASVGQDFFQVALGGTVPF